MMLTGFSSERITNNYERIIEQVTSFTISNYGNTYLDVTIGGVKRRVPAFNVAYGVPFGAFNMPGDGFVIENVTIKFEFEGGSGNAILDYRSLKKPIC